MFEGFYDDDTGKLLVKFVVKLSRILINYIPPSPLLNPDLKFPDYENWTYEPNFPKDQANHHTAVSSEAWAKLQGPDRQLNEDGCFWLFSQN